MVQSRITRFQQKTLSQLWPTPVTDVSKFAIWKQRVTGRCKKSCRKMMALNLVFVRPMIVAVIPTIISVGMTWYAKHIPSGGTLAVKFGGILAEMLSYNWSVRPFGQPFGRKSWSQSVENCTRIHMDQKSSKSELSRVISEHFLKIRNLGKINSGIIYNYGTLVLETRIKYLDGPVFCDNATDCIWMTVSI